jgi:Xaa-Pro dipeptidase
MDEYFPFWQYFNLSKALKNKQILHAKPILSFLRSIKSPKEIANIKKANEISLWVHEQALNSLREGIKMSELDKIYRDLHISQGCTDPWGGGSFGIASSYIHGTAQDIKLKEGMVILADAGAKYNGYFSDVSRTICFGKPTDEISKAWDLAQKCQIEGINALKPGAPSENVDLAIREVLEKNNYKPSYTYLPHRAGHGIGLDIHEDPFLVEGNKNLLEPGMVVAFDGAFYIDQKFGIRLEDNFVITEDGCEIFGNKLATDINNPFGK